MENNFWGWLIKNLIDKKYVYNIYIYIMKTSRVPNQTKNNSTFDPWARRKAQEEKMKNQMFGYRTEDGNLKLEGPVFKMKPMLEDGTAVEGVVEMEWGGRIHKTDENGTLTIVNNDYLQDRGAVSNDKRDYFIWTSGNNHGY